MRVTDKNEQGSMILTILLCMGAFAIAVTYISQRFERNLKLQLSEQLTRQKLAIADGISKATHCSSTLGMYNSLNRCPEGTKLNLTFVGREASPTTGPDGSIPLSSDWYAQVTCGKNDIRLALAQYSKNKYTRDPLTGKNLDFSHPAAQVSDKKNGVEICPGYFGDGTQNVTEYTMSIATLQDFSAVRWGTGGTVSNIVHRCDGKMGMLAEVDAANLPKYWRDGGGGPNKRSSYAEYIHKSFKEFYMHAGFGHLRLKQDWIYPFTARVHVGQISCDRFCIYNAPKKYRQGFITKCDPTAPSSALGTVLDNRNSLQATCLCIR